LENFLINDLNQETILDFKECFDKNDSPKILENIEWQFFDNTEKRSVVDIAKDKASGKTAAIYAISCVKFKLNDTLVTGSQSLDTITDIDYRGVGLFIKLANDVYHKAKQSVNLVYGFPNGNSIAGFKKKLQWHVLDPVPFLIKPLRSKYFTNKIKALKFLPDVNLSFITYKDQKGYNIVGNHSFGIEVNEIWQKFSQNIKVCINRDYKYLHWRYIQKPNEQYAIAHCYKQNRYVGFIVYTIKEKHEGKIGYIMELIYDPEEPKAGKLLLKYAISIIREQKADCILSWCLEHSPNYPIFKNALFFYLPEKIRPIELHFGARSFDDGCDSLISNRNNWYISYSDSDTV